MGWHLLSRSLNLQRLYNHSILTGGHKKEEDTMAQALRDRVAVPPAAPGEFIMETGPPTGSLSILAEQQMAERARDAELRYSGRLAPAPPQDIQQEYEQKLARRQVLFRKAAENNVPPEELMKRLRIEGLEDIEMPETPKTLEGYQVEQLRRGETTLPEAYKAQTEAKSPKAYEPPAIIKEAQSLVEGGVAKDLKEAYKLVKEGKTKKLTKEDFLAKAYQNILNNELLANEPQMVQDALRRAEEYYDTSIAKTKTLTLDKETASTLLKEAGGDKNKARQLAKERGYTF